MKETEEEKQMTLVRLQNSEVARIFSETMEFFNRQMLMNFSPENVHLQIIQEEPDVVTMSGWNRKKSAAGTWESAPDEASFTSSFTDARGERMSPQQRGKFQSQEDFSCSPEGVSATVSAGRAELSSEETCRESFLRQLTDLFCFYYEIDGGFFYQRYCTRRQQENAAGIQCSDLRTGYRLWAPLIRQLLMERLSPAPPYSLAEVSPQIAALEEAIQDCEHDSTGSGAQLFSLITLASDGLAGCRQWDVMQDRLDRIGVGYTESLHHIFRKIHGRSLRMYDTEDCVYRISPLFIRGLGERFTREREEAYYGHRNLLHVTG